MKKHVWFITLLLVLIGITVVCTVINNDGNITEKQAIRIADAEIKKRYYSYIKYYYGVTVEENIDGDVYRVVRTFDDPEIVGGAFMVEINKSDGKVINFELWD